MYSIETQKLLSWIQQPTSNFLCVSCEQISASNRPAALCLSSAGFSFLPRPCRNQKRLAEDISSFRVDSVSFLTFLRVAFGEVRTTATVIPKPIAFHLKPTQTWEYLYFRGNSFVKPIVEIPFACPHNDEFSPTEMKFKSKPLMMSCP